MSSAKRVKITSQLKKKNKNKILIPTFILFCLVFRVFKDLLEIPFNGSSQMLSSLAAG
jgi:uncharacterized membrane protein YadS